METNFDLAAPEAIDHASPHIRRSWYANRRIVVYELLDVSQTIMNEWAQLALDTIQAWAPGQPYLALHDISQHGVAMKIGWLHADLRNPAITDFGRARLFPTPAAEARFQGRIALLVSLQLSGNFARVLVDQRSARPPQAGLQHKCFTTREAAFEWLRAGLE
jgi:hypothetical protein